MSTGDPACRDPGERLIQGLERCRDILDRQYDALRAGKLEQARELGEQERRTVDRIEALEKTLKGGGGYVPGDPTHRAARDRLRAEVLLRNRRNRELLTGELLGLRKRITQRRVRLGTPSVYTQTGRATLIDLTR